MYENGHFSLGSKCGNLRCQNFPKTVEVLSTEGEDFLLVINWFFPSSLFLDQRIPRASYGTQGRDWRTLRGNETSQNFKSWESSSELKGCL